MMCSYRNDAINIVLVFVNGFKKTATANYISLVKNLTLIKKIRHVSELATLHAVISVSKSLISRHLTPFCLRVPKNAILGRKPNLIATSYNTIIRHVGRYTMTLEHSEILVVLVPHPEMDHGSRLVRTP